MFFDTPPAFMRGILPSASERTRCHRWHRAEAHLSRSVAFRYAGTRSRLPGGTVAGCPSNQGGSQDIQRGVVVPVQHQATGRTDMGAHAQALFDPRSTARAILGREARRHGYDGDTMQPAIIAYPTQEAVPARITDAFGKVMVLDQTSDVQVFKGDQIVRLDERTCRLRGEVFTLPLDLQMLFCQALDSFPAILGALLFLGDTPLQAFEPLFCFPEIARIGNRVAVRVGVECLQAHINAERLVGGLVLYLPVCLNGKLHIVAIRTLDQPHALDLLDGERFNAACADQAYTADTQAIREDEALAIWFQLPARSLVLHTAIVLLEARVALLAWFLRCAVHIEAGYRLPRPVCCCLSSHRIEPGGKGIRFCQLRAEGLQVVLAHAASIHPESDGFVADKLCDANGLINRALLACVRSQLVFEYQHGCLACGRLHGWQFPAWRYGRYHLPLPLHSKGAGPGLSIGTWLLFSYGHYTAYCNMLSIHEAAALHPQASMPGLSRSPLVRGEHDAHLFC